MWRKECDDCQIGAGIGIGDRRILEAGDLRGTAGEVDVQAGRRDRDSDVDADLGRTEAIVVAFVERAVVIVASMASAAAWTVKFAVTFAPLTTTG